MQRHDDLIKALAVRKATFIRSTCNNAVSMGGDWCWVVLVANIHSKDIPGVLDIVWKVFLFRFYCKNATCNHT